MFGVERQTLSICLPLFRLGSGPSSFQKIDEDSNSCHKELEWDDYNLSRRNLVNDRAQGRFIDTNRYSHFALQNLDFIIIFKKSVLDPCHVLEFLGLEIDSLNMRVEHPKKKLEKVKKRYQSLLSLGKVSVRDLAKLTERLSSTATEVLPAPLQYKDLQQQQNKGFSMRGSYEDTIVLQKEAKMELDWWVQNLDLNNEWCILSTAPQIVIQSNASKSGWGQCAKGNQLGVLGHKRKGENISTFSN